jgi:hypothetical protein
MTANPPREYTVVVERDGEGYYVATVPSLPGCHTQARSLDELMERVKEAIELSRCWSAQGFKSFVSAAATTSCTIRMAPRQLFPPIPAKR